MFEEAEWDQLVETLSRLTRANTLEWKEGFGEIEARVGQMIYAIGSVDNDGRLPYYLDVRPASTAEPLARLESQPLPEFDPGWITSLTAAQKLPELRALAQRSALGAPQLFNRLIGDLNALGEETPF